MDAVERLHSIEEVRQVKYRHLRCVDLKLWEEIGDTLTENATVNYGMSGFDEPLEITGRAEIVAFFRAKLGPGTLSSHAAGQPEITVDGDIATGIWSLRDTVLATRHRMLISGAAFGHDRYERCADARWRIAHTSYLSGYEAVLSLDDLPSFKITAPFENEPSGEPMRTPPPADIGSVSVPMRYCIAALSEGMVPYERD